ncbi:MAG: replicative DNA helicase [Candidatus Aminicenantes bacterium]|nr:replicative DNA helicase [Candidatus Aminicenantes bacterium]
MELDLMFLKKTPPHSPEAERTVLGAILVANENLNVVLSIISLDDFYKDAHKKILGAIIVLIEKHVGVELLSLNEELRRAGLLDEVGGAAYIGSLVDGVPRSLNVEYYARVIKEKAVLRRLIFASARIIQAGYEEKMDPDDLLGEAQAAIIDASEQRIKQGFIPLREIAEPALKIIEEHRGKNNAVTGVPTGFPDLDRLTLGFQPSEMIIVAARPSMGKTALCLNISQHVGLKTNYAVGFFSMEMSKESLAMRMLCADAEVDIREARSGFVNDVEMERLRLSAESLSRARIYIDETPGLSLTEMKAKARRLKLEHHLDIVFLDYIQLMRAGDRFENRNQEMANISRSLKELAKELHIPVVGISQLSRAPEKGRKEPKPQLSDLRESGALEQDADVVMFIYRKERYLSKEDRLKDDTWKGIAEIDVAKQRNGPTDSIYVAFRDKFAKFESTDQAAVRALIQRSRSGDEE